MELSVEQSPDGAVKLSGDLDLQTAFVLRETLLELLTSKAEIRLDLSNVRSCDWVGLQLLCSSHKSAVTAEKPFCISALSPAVINASAAIGLPLSAFSNNTST